MECPKCGSEMDSKEESQPNFFLFVTTKTTYYEYERCPECGYETEKRAVGVRGFSSGYQSLDDEDDT